MLRTASKRLVDQLHAVTDPRGLTVGLLCRRGSNRGARLFLAIAVLAVALSAARVVYVHAGGAERDLVAAVEALQWVFGPAFYLHASALVRPDAVRRTWPHFLPFGICLVWELTHPGGMSWVRFAWQCAVELHGATYLVVALVHLRRSRHELEGEHPPLDERDMRWLRILFGALLALWLGSSLAFVTGLPILPWVHFGITAVVYAVAHRGGRAPALAPTTAKYRKSRLREDEVRLVETRLAACFAKEKPYLDPDLTLSALAERIGVPPHQLSQILNERRKTTFHDFVNLARVEEVKSRLASARGNVNLLEVALASGFASKSSFNANFRKHTGLSPTAWRATLEAQAEPSHALAVSS